MDIDAFLDILRGCRSIRRHKPDDVPDELLHLIMEAGRLAPSGDNNQPWRFIVIRDVEIKKRTGLAVEIADIEFDESNDKHIVNVVVFDQELSSKET